MNSAARSRKSYWVGTGFERVAEAKAAYSLFRLETYLQVCRSNVYTTRKPLT